MVALGPQMLYVFGPRDAGLVKIGISGCPSKRLEDLQRGHDQTLCPPGIRRPTLVLLHQQPGGRRLELRLHRRFAHRRVHGEWFDLGPLAVSLIRSACREPGETAAASADAIGWKPRRGSSRVIDHRLAAERLAFEFGVELHKRRGS